MSHRDCPTDYRVLRKDNKGERVSFDADILLYMEPFNGDNLLIRHLKEPYAQILFFCFNVYLYTEEPLWFVEAGKFGQHLKILRYF